ncbi:MAG: flagellar filament capping protein FliD [Tissierellia bacterium]|nr:flagellar filament capping protein FliD [Tissierellia bacterium]
MYNTMRITGLASGIDTEEMINSLMQAERVKVDRVEQDRQIVLWRQEMYNDLNKDFANFIMNTRKMFGLTSISYTGAFVSNSYKNLSWVKKATSSNENIAKVSTTAKSLDGNYKVEVDKLAEGVSLASGVDIRKSENNSGLVNKAGKIVDNNGAIIKDIEFTINDGKNDFEIKISKDEGITINDIVKTINTAKKTVNGKEVSLEAKASYDANIGRFFLQTTETGEDAKIKINVEDDISRYFIDALKLTNGEKDVDNEIKFYTIGEEIAGQDAVINFNGAEGITSSTNRITINGITMDLTGTGEFTINVSTDVDAVYEKIEQFVEEYNKLVEKTNQLLGEKKYRDYKPLTSEQKKAMEKEDIELWEEKAKSGLLRSDDLINRTMLNIRRSLYEKSAGIEGSYQLITEIGISTEKYARGSAGGKLVIDEQKLKDAIAKDPEGVMELLFKESNIDNVVEIDGKEVAQVGGIVTRVYENLMAGMEDIIKKSGTGENAELYRGVKPNILLEFVSEYSSISLLDKDILQYSRRIDDLNEMLFRKENQYYAKFAAMEKAISRMNSQSMWMMQQFMS